MRVASVKVHELCEQIRGVSYDKSEPVSQATPGYLPLLRANNITDSGLVFDELIFVPEKRVDPRQRLQLHDVVIATSSGSRDVVGKAADVRTDLSGTFGAFCKVLRPNQKVHPGYFSHFFKTPYYRRTISALAGGANINNLRNEHLDNLDVPLPSLADQQRISHVLDKAESLRTSRRTALAHLNSLSRSLFLEFFGSPNSTERQWPVIKIGDAGKVQLGRQRAPKYQTGRFPRPYMRVANVFEDRIDVSDVLSMDFDDDDYDAYCLEYGDILLNEGQSTELVGRPAMWRDELGDCCFQNTLVRFKADRQKVVPEYALALFLHYFRSGQFAKISTKTSSIAHLGAGRFAAMPFLLPPLPLQQEFARRVAAIEKLKATQRASLAELDALFASLQDRAFRGEL